MNSWKKILNQSLRAKSQLEDFFQYPFPSTPYPILLPKRMAQKIKAQGLNGPLGLQFLPQDEEKTFPGGGLDPIGDDIYRQEKGIIHRYENRILISPTPLCPVQCRYCFRKNNLSQTPEQYRGQLSLLQQYLASHPKVNEVIFTGGDPLMVSDSILESYFLTLQKFSQVKFVRLHTRTPIILPERITPPFVHLLQRFQKVFAQLHLVIHINHWSEADHDIITAIGELQKAHVSLMSQSVLLKNVNDTTDDLYQLFLNLAQLGVRPYYLHHPDRVRGAMHFYIPLEQGQKIYHPLRRILPGWAMPNYVVELPEGKGKAVALSLQESDLVDSIKF